MRKRDEILEIFNAGLKAAEPFSAMQKVLNLDGNLLQVRIGNEIVQSYDVDQFSSVQVVGCGKAAAVMAEFTEILLGEKISSGLVAVKHGYRGNNELEKIRLIEGGHPWPDQTSVNAASETVKMLGAAVESDLVIALVSGGGSSLWTLPAPGIQLEDLVSLSELLLRSGADIREMNIVRKHFSRIKGGQAAQWAYPAHVLAVAISDVPDNSFSTIASGPFSPDESTFQDAADILNRYSLKNAVPVSVSRYLQEGLEKGAGETPKADNICFHNVLQVKAASNSSALDSCRRKAEEVGYKPILIETPLTGEASDAFSRIHGRIKELSVSGQKYCIIAGGETTVTLGEIHGQGGRNQELALSAAFQIEASPNITFLSCSTDGSDGPTDAAGAVVDSYTIRDLRERNIDPRKHLLEHNSYTALNAAGSLVRTGPTNTNVMDIQIALIN
ncbi:MAG: glycerate kinase [Chitinispirillaceae bacterium]